MCAGDVDPVVGAVDLTRTHDLLTYLLLHDGDTELAATVCAKLTEDPAKGQAVVLPALVCVAESLPGDFPTPAPFTLPVADPRPRHHPLFRVHSSGLIFLAARERCLCRSDSPIVVHPPFPASPFVSFPSFLLAHVSFFLFW